MKVFISQSNYIPWHGFFAMIRHVDLYVILDTVQFTRRDWRTRNKIVLNGTDRWLTIPVRGSRSQTINQVSVSSFEWPGQHLSTIKSAYGPFMTPDIWGFLRDTYARVTDKESLSEINELLTRQLLDQLGIDTPIIRSEGLPDASDASARLAVMASAVGASEYWTGPAAHNYLDHIPFEDRGIDVKYFDLSRLAGLQSDIAENRPGGYSIVHDMAHFGSSGASHRSTFVG